ncbi:MAG: hypothetical protein JW744_00750, partial [Candidatus Diapherotrites archaeon]|nr:hypothetical protein [Candidatus Diapherotrites archaeon]
FVEPQELQVNKEKMLENFIMGKEKQQGAWLDLLGKENFNAVDEMEKPEIGPELWSRIVFDCIAAFKGEEGKVIDALIPLWLGRNYSFIEETENLGNEEAEKLILEQGKVFFKNRGYLLEKI